MGSDRFSDGVGECGGGVGGVWGWTTWLGVSGCGDLATGNSGGGACLQ